LLHNSIFSSSVNGGFSGITSTTSTGSSTVSLLLEDGTVIRITINHIKPMKIADHIHKTT
jgi:hypothetical protein